MESAKEYILNPEIVANRVFNPSLMLDKLAIGITITKKPPSRWLNCFC